MCRGLKAILVLVFCTGAWADVADISARPIYDVAGHSKQLKDYAQNAKFLILIFHTVGCPILRRSYPSLQRLVTRFKGRASFAFVNSNVQDSLPRIRQNLEQFPINIPIIKDPHQDILRDLKVTTAATAVVLNTENWNVEYQGAISDQFSYSQSQSAPQKEFLTETLDALLAGQPVPVKKTKVFGCLITLEKTTIR